MNFLDLVREPNSISNTNEALVAKKSGDNGDLQSSIQVALPTRYALSLMIQRKIDQFQTYSHWLQANLEASPDQSS